MLPSSSSAFGTPVHPIRITKPAENSKPAGLPISLPPAILRPLAFRTLTKKHSLTITSSALELLAAFIGKYCGSGWREEGLAERVLEDAARVWKKDGNGVIIKGEGDELRHILRHIEASVAGGKSPSQMAPTGSRMLPDGVAGVKRQTTSLEVISKEMDREESQKSLEVFYLDIDNHSESSNEARDPRQWARVIGAFDQPRLMYNVQQKHFETALRTPSMLPNPSQKTHLFRHRYDLIHQRLLRNESFQTSSVANARPRLPGRSSTIASIQQAYKITSIANLLGRSGSSHLLLGLLTRSPTGILTLNDPTASISLDIMHARPVPEDGAWFTPGMIVLIDGIYEEEGSGAGLSLDGNCGVGGTLGGKFIVFSIGGPPCERREVTLGMIGVGKDNDPGAGGGFGWVDFLGTGSERAVGSAMRRLESHILRNRAGETTLEGRGRMVILGEVHLDDSRTLQALRRIMSLYAADQADQTPMVVLLMGSFVHYAVMSGGGSGGSIEYKEYFDSLAATLSDYPTMLQNTTFVFVPGDNDPWASSFSAGAATVLPRSPVPELFTSRIKRVFATANAEAEKTVGKMTNGEVIWSTNPTRLTLFGPAQEIVLFRDDMSSRLRRHAVKFRPFERESVDLADVAPDEIREVEPGAKELDTETIRSIHIDGTVRAAESLRPTLKTKEGANSTAALDVNIARKLVKTILDQGFLSPFPLSDRPVLWDYAGALQLYPLPTALVLADPEAPPFAVTYEGCHVMNPGPLTPPGKGGIAQWMEYDPKTRRGNLREVRF